MFGFWYEQKIYLSGAQVDFAFTVYDTGPGIEHKGLAGGHALFDTPIKHMYRKNQRIFGIGLANHLILLMPQFLIACHARKTWCGKFLI